MAELYVIGLQIDENWRLLDPRVINCVQNAGLLIAEERKSALRLLAATEARDKEFILLNEHSDDKDRANALQKVLLAGMTAFVSDAGTPCIADPDFRFVELCVKNGVKVLSVPGASSITAALSVSGFDCSRFMFMGFPPRDKKARTAFFDEVNNMKVTGVFLERPYKLADMLEELKKLKREFSLSMALGTAQEKTIRGRAADLAHTDLDTIKLPYVVVVKGQ